MRASECDICGKGDVHLSSLLLSYQTDAIKEVCPDCEKVVNKHHGKLMDLTLNMKRTWFKQFLTNMRAKFQPEPPHAD